MAYNLFEATLDGVAFSSLGAELILVDIIEHEAKMDTQTVPRGGDYGLMRTVNRRESLSVELVFCARTQDVQRRAALLAKVTGWAVNGGALKINSRPGKILYVVMDTPPALKSSAKWTDEITLTLTAYDVPYWQSEAVSSADGNAVSAENGEYKFTTSLYVDGQIETNVSVVAMTTDAFLSRFSVRCGETMIELVGMGAQPVEALKIAYSGGILTIENMYAETDKSLLKYRTVDSSDDLKAKASAANEIVVSGDAPLLANMQARGLWL